MKQTFAEKYPNLAREWDYERNLSVNIGDVTEKSRKSVNWMCPSGHRYEASVRDRAIGKGCPYDSGKIKLWDWNGADEEAT